MGTSITHGTRRILENPEIGSVWVLDNNWRRITGYVGPCICYETFSSTIKHQLELASIDYVTWRTTAKVIHLKEGS